MVRCHSAPSSDRARKTSCSSRGSGRALDGGVGGAPGLCPPGDLLPATQRVLDRALAQAQRNWHAVGAMPGSAVSAQSILSPRLTRVLGMRVRRIDSVRLMA